MLNALIFAQVQLLPPIEQRRGAQSSVASQTVSHGIFTFRLCGDLLQFTAKLKLITARQAGSKVASSKQQAARKQEAAKQPSSQLCPLRHLDI